MQSRSSPQNSAFPKAERSYFLRLQKGLLRVKVLVFSQTCVFTVGEYFWSLFIYFSIFDIYTAGQQPLSENESFQVSKKVCVVTNRINCSCLEKSISLRNSVDDAVSYRNIISFDF